MRISGSWTKRSARSSSCARKQQHRVARMQEKWEDEQKGWSLGSGVTPEFRAACRRFPRTTAARSATAPSASPATPARAAPFGPPSSRRSYSSSLAAGGAAELPQGEGNFVSQPAGGGHGKGEGSGCHWGQRDCCPHAGVWSAGWVRFHLPLARLLCWAGGAAVRVAREGLCTPWSLVGGVGTQRGQKLSASTGPSPVACHHRGIRQGLPASSVSFPPTCYPGNLNTK